MGQLTMHAPQPESNDQYRRAGSSPSAARRRAVTSAGRPGWLATGARTAGSTAHREHEPAGEAHPYRTDTWSAALGVRPRGEHPQPVFCRVSPVGETRELPRRTHVHNNLEVFGTVIG